MDYNIRRDLVKGILLVIIMSRLFQFRYDSSGNSSRDNSFSITPYRLFPGQKFGAVCSVT